MIVVHNYSLISSTPDTRPKALVYYRRITIYLTLVASFLAIASCAETSSGPIKIAVVKTKDIDFKKFSSDKVASFRNQGPKSEQSDRMFAFLKTKFEHLGFREVPPKTLANSVTLIWSNIGKFSFRNTDKNFKANRSLDVMLCHDPISSQVDVSFKCDHIIFEYYQTNKYPEEMFRDFVWSQISNAEPKQINSTRAFAEPELFTIQN